jgi:hypothetical protein
MNKEHAMNPPESTMHRLRRNDFLRVPARRPVRVRAVRGSLWLTLDDDPVDIQLDDGGSYDFDGSTRLIVSALGGDAQLTLTPLRRRGWWPRLHAALWGGRPSPAAQQRCCEQCG